jgi:hypothetical protein
METPESKSPPAKGPESLHIHAVDVETAPSSVQVQVVQHQTLDNSTSKSKPNMAGSVAAAPLQGFRLYAVAVGVCFGALMMSLDIAIIGTVRASQPPPTLSQPLPRAKVNTG